jgi:hypothetical protein
MSRNIIIAENSPSLTKDEPVRLHVLTWHRVTSIVGVTYRLIVKFRVLSCSYTLLLQQVASHLVEIFLVDYEATYTRAWYYTIQAASSNLSVLTSLIKVRLHISFPSTQRSPGSF